MKQNDHGSHMCVCECSTWIPLLGIVIIPLNYLKNPERKEKNP